MTSSMRKAFSFFKSRSVTERGKILFSSKRWRLIWMRMRFLGLIKRMRVLLVRIYWQIHIRGHLMDRKNEGLLQLQHKKKKGKKRMIIKSRKRKMVKNKKNWNILKMNQKKTERLCLPEKITTSDIELM